MDDMSEQGLQRPRQVTVSGGIGLVGCLVLVGGLFDTMASTRTVDGRNKVDDFLSRVPGSGLTVDEGLELWRSTLFVAGAIAAAAFVLGIYVFQRHNGARIGFTVAAGLLLLSIPAVGPLPVLLGVAAFGLWSEPARDWFAGRAPRPEPVRSQEQPPPRPMSPPPAPPPPVQQSGEQPPPSSYPYGARPPEQQAPQYDVPWSPPPQAGPGQRPRSVLLAAMLTWVFAGLTAAASVLAGLLIAIDRSGFEREFQKQLDKDPQLEDLGVTADQAMTYLWVTIAVVVLWCIVAAVFAFFALRRQTWARVLLIVSATGAALLSLIAVIAIVPLLTLVPSVATIALLLTRSANAWYTGRPQQPAQPRSGAW